MMEKIDISDASIAENVRKQMAVATSEQNGLMPAVRMKEEARAQSTGSNIVYNNFGASGAAIGTSLLISLASYGGGEMALYYMTIRRGNMLTTSPSIFLKKICGENVPYNNRFKLLNNDVTGEFKIILERTLYTPSIFVKILNTITALSEILPLTLASQNEIDSATYISES